MTSKRYQVFVSSTYNDLIEERAEIMQALLELDCMPAGMELFPAANEEQWNWIKKVIDESDYYLVIIGGRYGTISNATGMSFTEMEYRYAIETVKPVIAFLHEDPSKIEAGKTEGSSQAKKKLEQFRKLAEQRLCKYFTSPADLGAKMSRSITQLIKHHPSPGWIRANQIPEDHSQEVLNMKKHIEELEKRLRQVGLVEPAGTEKLSKGKDEFSVDFSFETKNAETAKNGAKYWKKDGEFDHTFKTSWDSLFTYLAPDLISPTSEYRVISRLNQFIEESNSSYFATKHENQKIYNIRIYSSSFDTLKIQLRALKLISIVDSDKWMLSPYGDNYMTKLLAVHKV
ncbi:protein of unknown function [Nitrosomonas ureae]|uniref:DUF4062 domain-containing protein n=1 Tax=Nitrosomonas ureae TaxID=44577 RepID=A0A285BUW1_9PROT|nr:DUF4062 domain-containing protein [Nitrosomonas ureae]SNX59081.1 protein of unknown function [Nitrosomonas ureae]